MVTDMFLSILDRSIDQFCIIRLLRGSEDERGIGGRILRLVFADCLSLGQGVMPLEEQCRWNDQRAKDAYLQSHLCCPSVMSQSQVGCSLDAHQNRTRRPLNHTQIGQPMSETFVEA